MTPDLQRKRDDEQPLRQRIDMAISHIAKHGWYDSGDLRRLLLDCKAKIENEETK